MDRSLTFEASGDLDNFERELSISKSQFYYL